MTDKQIFLCCLYLDTWDIRENVAEAVLVVRMRHTVPRDTQKTDVRMIIDNV